MKKLIIWLILQFKEVKEMFEKIRDFLSGKKTYLVVIAGLITAIVSWVNGQIDTAKLIELVLEAFAVIFLRTGISKSGIQ